MQKHSPAGVEKDKRRLDIEIIPALNALKEAVARLGQASFPRISTMQRAISN
jgi:hypothetical protein